MRRIIALLLTLTALTACQPRTNPADRAPWVPATPALTMVTITIPACGKAPVGNACYSAPSTLADNQGMETAMPEGYAVKGSWVTTLPACHREDDAGPCVWTGAPDGKKGPGRRLLAMPDNLIFPL